MSVGRDEQLAKLRRLEFQLVQQVDGDVQRADTPFELLRAGTQQGDQVRVAGEIFESRLDITFLLAGQLDPHRQRLGTLDQPLGQVGTLGLRIQTQRFHVPDVRHVGLVQHVGANELVVHAPFDHRALGRRGRVPLFG